MIGWLTLAFAMGACRKSAESKVELPVQNAVTEYVDSQVAALEKARATADRASATIQQQQQQMDTLNRRTDEPNQP